MSKCCVQFFFCQGSPVLGYWIPLTGPGRIRSRLTCPGYHVSVTMDKYDVHNEDDIVNKHTVNEILVSQIS